MRHIRQVRTLGVCLVALVALFAISGATAGAASAKSTLPEWGQCEVFLGAPATETEPARGPGEGRYGNSTCTDPVKPLFGKPHGEYEWYSGQLGGYNFEAGAVGPTTFETTTGKSIKCSSGEIYQLQIKGPKEVGKILSYFYGCHDEEEKECRGEINGNGEISDEEEWGDGEGLKGELVYLAGKSTATPTVGLALTAFRKPGEEYEHNATKELATGALFTVACEGALGTVQIGGAGGKKTEKAKGNAAVAVIAPVDQMTTAYTATFAQNAGVQQPAPEKGKARSLQAYLANENKWVQLGLASTWALPSEPGNPPVEIKAVK